MRKYGPFGAQITVIAWSESAHLEHHSGFLQQVRPHVGPDYAVALVEADLNVLPKPAAVVVPGGLSISNSLSQN